MTPKNLVIMVIKTSGNPVVIYQYYLNMLNSCQKSDLLQFTLVLSE